MGVLAAILSALMAAPLVAAAAELPAPLAGELARIEEQLAKIERNIGRKERSRIELELQETRQRVEEFLLDAELVDDDPLVRRLHRRLEDLSKKVSSYEPPAPPRPEKKTPPPPTREELDAMVKIPIDLANVSFKKDVAPIIASACMGCHHSNRKSGQFDASSYASFVTMIEPGDPENSHVLNLVTGKAEPRMPRGAQTRFEREWAAIWTAWIKQGAKFDGPDKSAPITNYLIDRELQRRQAFERLPTAELERLHRGHAQRQIDIVRPKDQVTFKETRNFLLHATTAEEDAEYIAVLSEAVVEDLVNRFRPPTDQPAFRGRLGLVVFANRADYVAFARQIDDYEPETTQWGHVRLRPEHAYVALASSGPGPSLDERVAQKVTEAYLRTLGQGKLPDWAVHGFARIQAAATAPKSGSAREELAQASELVRRGKTVWNVIHSEVPWHEAAPLSASLFAYMNQVDKARTTQFVRALAEHGDAERALREQLRASHEQLTRSWGAWLQSSRPAPSPRRRGKG